MALCLVLPLTCLTFSSCRDATTGPSAANRRIVATKPASTSDGRIRYALGRRPVLFAPDGSQRTVASMLTVPSRMAFGDYVWRDVASLNAPIWVRIDLARQLLSVFRGDDEIGTTVIIYGTDGKETPTGVFPVRGKERMHRSRAYEADMPFTMWLTADGVAIHASTIERGRATHGCIGVPAGFAEKLFAVMEKGDIVIIEPTPATSSSP